MDVSLLITFVSTSFLVRNVILWSPGFALDFLLGPDITNEKFALGMIIFGCILIGLGYKRPNVKIN